MKSVLLLTTVMLAAPSAEPATILVVVGAPGTPEYAKAFRAWADRWEQTAAEAGATCRRIDIDDAAQPALDARSRLKTQLEQQSETSTAPLWLVLIGHGTFDGRKAKFNLQGRDVTATELNEWLAPCRRPLVVINCASSSAPFINRLSAPGRIVVTASKSGYEQNYARFGDYFSSAIADPEADLDKDEQTSLLEAFLLASRRVAEFYDRQARLATESALIDDNGDGLGTPATWFHGIHATRQAKPGGKLDGVRAHQVHLIPSERERSMPAESRARRDELEQSIALLRGSRTETNDDEYYAKLKPLMIELAELYRSLEED